MTLIYACCRGYCCHSGWCLSGSRNLGSKGSCMSLWKMFVWFVCMWRKMLSPHSVCVCVCVCVWEREGEGERMILKRMCLDAQACVQLCETSSVGTGFWVMIGWEWSDGGFASEESFWCHPDKLGRDVWVCACMKRYRAVGVSTCVFLCLLEIRVSHTDCSALRSWRRC